LTLQFWIFLHKNAIDVPLGRAKRYSLIGSGLDGRFRLKKNWFVVRLTVCLHDGPAISFALADCHLTWASKYRKWVLRGDIRERVEELFREIGERQDIEIDKLEVAGDHVHLFVSFPPRLSISKVVGTLKANPARVMLGEFSEEKKGDARRGARGKTDILPERSGTR
jgi:REP element-mobilizing transposase RayT